MSTHPRPHTLETAVHTTAQTLAAADFFEALTDARLLVQAATGLDRAALMRDPEAPLGAEGEAKLAAFVARRLSGEPVTRILGLRGFWSVDLTVTPDVLDPRPDSETLIEAAIVGLAGRLRQPLRILDLGTGSGALLCAMLMELPLAQGVGVDLSPQAAAVARGNIARCGLSHRAEVLVGDWFAPITGTFDLILSNPPYIRHGDIAWLDAEVRDHDPHLALDGGVDGLDAYRALAPGIAQHLSPTGVAILEFGAGQERDVAAILRDAGLDVQGTRRDLGGHIRAITVGHSPVGCS